MIRALEKYVQRTLRNRGYRVERWRPANRFGAMHDALQFLASRGYDPRVVIDGGANVGQWLRIAASVFPRARFEVVEPQPACHAALESLSAAYSGVTLHKVALTVPGQQTVSMAGGSAAGSSGSYVVDPGDPNAEIVCPAATLDSLFAERVGAADRVLLKLDLEGREMDALQGAAALLPNVEVLLFETQFFHINGNRQPCFGEMVSFLGNRGFVVYDVAGLSGRGRDNRLVLGDVIAVRATSALCRDDAWE